MSASLPDGRVTVRANQDKRNHTGLRSLIHPIVDRAPLYEHITRLEMHEGIVHLHVDFARHHHRVINAVGPMVTGCDAGLKFDDPEHRPISDGGADLSGSFVFAIFGEMDWQIIGRPDELPRHIWPATRDVGSHVVNPDYGLAMSVVARHHTADVDCHSAPPCLLRKRDLLSGLKLWQGYGTAGASAILLDMIASCEMYRQAERRRANHV